MDSQQKKKEDLNSAQCDSGEMTRSDKIFVWYGITYLFTFTRQTFYFLQLDTHTPKYQEKELRSDHISNFIGRLIRFLMILMIIVCNNRIVKLILIFFIRNKKKVLWHKKCSHITNFVVVRLSLSSSWD